MNTNDLNHIREEEKEYHEQYFADHRLYEEGSWLEEPEPRILKFLSLLNRDEPLQILDLGCGVGRNSIPMASMVKDSGGRVICVDLLQQALDQLDAYSQQYKVDSVITTHPADISDFSFLQDSYDYILAASSLEHVKSEFILKKVLHAMVKGTKASGINLIYMNTNIKEITIATGVEREPLFEIQISKEALLAHLREAYEGWEELHVTDQSLELEITRDETPVMLMADHLVFAARKPLSSNGSLFCSQ
jgi:2-polyprenyl-3-methyl-5-hydroxy-6-metoxy-1,4-benzoquinol methylase